MRAAKRFISLRNDQHRRALVRQELGDAPHLSQQQITKQRCARVATAQIDQLGRRAERQHAMMEVRVLRHDGKVVVAREVPKRFVARRLKTQLNNMSRTRKEKSEVCEQPNGHVLIEKQLHLGHEKCAFTVGGEAQTCTEILCFKFRVICKYLELAHARAKQIKNLVHCDAQTANAWLAATLARLNGNTGFQFHGLSLARLSAAYHPHSTLENVYANALDVVAQVGACDGLEGNHVKDVGQR